MSIDIMNLLNEVRDIYGMNKRAYVPSPAFSEEAKQAQQKPQEQQGSGVISSPEQAIEIVIQNLQQGVDPNAIAEALVQQGVPQEAIPQIMDVAMKQVGGQQAQQTAQQPPQQPPQQEAPQPPELPPQKTRNIDKEIEEKVNDELKELKKKSLPIEDRVDLLERKLDKLIDLVQDIDNITQQIVSNIPQKQASLEKILSDNKKIMGNDYEIDELTDVGSIP